MLYLAFFLFSLIKGNLSVNKKSLILCIEGRNIRSVAFAKDHLVDAETFEKEYQDSQPLTRPYRDIDGRLIQLWKNRRYGLIGSVLDLEGDLRLIPGEKIRNPLDSRQTPNAFMSCLEKALHNWDIIPILRNTETF